MGSSFEVSSLEFGAEGLGLRPDSGLWGLGSRLLVAYLGTSIHKLRSL